MVHNSKHKLSFVFEATQHKVTEAIGVEFLQFCAFSREKGEMFTRDDEQIGPWGRVCVTNAKEEKVHS